MAIPDLLRGCPLFFELFDDEIEKIVKYCTVFTFESGDAIVSEGQEGNEIFVLLEGQAVVQKNVSGELLRIQELRAGDVFGEMVLVDEKTRSADIKAEVRCYVLEIKYDDVFALFKSEPQIFGLMILNLSRLLAKRLRSSNELIMKIQSSSSAR